MYTKFIFSICTWNVLLKLQFLGELLGRSCLWLKKSWYSEHRTYPCGMHFLCLLPLSVSSKGRDYVCFAHWYLAQNGPSINVYWINKSTLFPVLLLFITSANKQAPTCMGRVLSCATPHGVLTTVVPIWLGLFLKVRAAEELESFHLQRRMGQSMTT